MIVVVSSAGPRWARTTIGTAIWTATKTARVTAIAGTVRRRTIPAVTPTANANAAWPIGAMPRASNIQGEIRESPKNPFAPCPLSIAVWIGPDHQVITRLSSPTAAIAARPVSPTFVASQRVRFRV